MCRKAALLLFSLWNEECRRVRKSAPFFFFLFTVILILLFFSVIFTLYCSFPMYISFSFSFLFSLFAFCSVHLFFSFISFSFLFRCHFLFPSCNFLLFSVISFSPTVTLLSCRTVLRCECDLGKLQSQVRMKVLSSCTDAPDVLGITCWVTFTITSCSLTGVDETLIHPCLSSLIPNFGYQVPSVPVGNRNYIDLFITLKTWRPWTDGPERHVIIFISFSSWIFELWLTQSQQKSVSVRIHIELVNLVHKVCGVNQWPTFWPPSDQSWICPSTSFIPLNATEKGQNWQ